MFQRDERRGTTWNARERFSRSSRSSRLFFNTVTLETLQHSNIETL